MQARRSVLHKAPALVEPITYFRDDYTACTQNAYLHGQPASDGVGTWADRPGITTRAFVHSPSLYIRSANQNYDFGDIQPIGPAPFNHDRMRITTDVFMRQMQERYHFTGTITYLNKNDLKTGIHEYSSASTANSSHKVVVRLYRTPGGLLDDIYDSGDGAFESDIWYSRELHLEKVSPTILKVGLKVSGVWEYGPVEQAVDSTFFDHSDVILRVRNNTSHSTAALNRLFVIDNQVDW